MNISKLLIMLIAGAITTDTMLAPPKKTKSTGEESKKTKSKRGVKPAPNDANEPKAIPEKAAADYHISNIKHDELRNYVQTKYLEFNNLTISFIGKTFPANKIEGFGIQYLLPDNKTLAGINFLDHPLPDKNDVISVIKACAQYLESLELRCSDITSDELVKAFGEAKLFTSLTLFDCKNFQRNEDHSDDLATKLIAVCPSFEKLVFQCSKN